MVTHKKYYLALFGYFSEDVTGQSIMWAQTL